MQSMMSLKEAKRLSEFTMIGRAFNKLTAKGVPFDATQKFAVVTYFPIAVKDADAPVIGTVIYSSHPIVDCAYRDDGAVKISVERFGGVADELLPTVTKIMVTFAAKPGTYVAIKSEINWSGSSFSLALAAAITGCPPACYTGACDINGVFTRAGKLGRKWQCIATHDFVCLSDAIKAQDDVQSLLDASGQCVPLYTAFIDDNWKSIDFSSFLCCLGVDAAQTLYLYAALIYRTTHMEAAEPSEDRRIKRDEIRTKDATVLAQFRENPRRFEEQPLTSKPAPGSTKTYTVYPYNTEKMLTLFQKLMEYAKGSPKYWADKGITGKKYDALKNQITQTAVNGVYTAYHAGFNNSGEPMKAEVITTQATVVANWFARLKYGVYEVPDRGPAQDAKFTRGVPGEKRTRSAVPIEEALRRAIERRNENDDVETDSEVPSSREDSEEAPPPKQSRYEGRPPTRNVDYVASDDDSEVEARRTRKPKKELEKVPTREVPKRTGAAPAKKSGTFAGKRGLPSRLK